jgi:hypothetical protein
MNINSKEAFYTVSIIFLTLVILYVSQEIPAFAAVGKLIIIFAVAVGLLLRYLISKSRKDD